jgi:hypothetical protein
MSNIALLFVVALAAPASPPPMAAPKAKATTAPAKAPAAPQKAKAPVADPHAGHNHGPSRPEPRGPVTNDTSQLGLWISFRVMAIENEKIYLALTYSIVNNGTLTFHAGSHGLLLPMPDGAKGVAVPRGTKGASVTKGKVLVLRRVPTGRHGLRIQASCNLPYDRSEQLVKLRSQLPIIGYSVSMKKYRTVRISAKSLSKPETFNHGEADTPWLVYRSESDAPPRHEVHFRVQKLPVRSRAGSWLAAGLALLMIFAAIGLSLTHDRRTRQAGPNGGDTLTDNLVRIERDRLLGIITDAQAQQYAADLGAGPKPADSAPTSKSSNKKKSKKG